MESDIFCHQRNIQFRYPVLSDQHRSCIVGFWTRRWDGLAVTTAVATAVAATTPTTHSTAPTGHIAHGIISDSVWDGAQPGGRVGARTGPRRGRGVPIEDSIAAAGGGARSSAAPGR